MRLSDFALIISIAALGYASGILALTLAGSDETVANVERITRLGSVDPAPARARLLEAWPPIFGVPVAIEPSVEETPEKIEPAVETAPMVWREFTLKGLVINRSQKWAFIVSDREQALVNIGDTLEDGEVVVQIDAEGVWLEKQGERNLVGFKEDELVSIAILPSLSTLYGDDIPPAQAEEIRIQDLDEEGLRNLLEIVRSRPSLLRPTTQ